MQVIILLISYSGINLSQDRRRIHDLKKQRWWYGTVWALEESYKISEDGENIKASKHVLSTYILFRLIGEDR